MVQYNNMPKKDRFARKGWESGAMLPDGYITSRISLHDVRNKTIYAYENLFILTKPRQVKVKFQ